MDVFVSFHGELVSKLAIRKPPVLRFGLTALSRYDTIIPWIEQLAKVVQVLPASTSAQSSCSTTASTSAPSTCTPATLTTPAPTPTSSIPGQPRRSVTTGSWHQP